MVSDEQLLVTSVGDEEAFAAFYRRHARPLARFFTWCTGNAEFAADLTAETFAAALAARRRFNGVARCPKRLDSSQSATSKRMWWKWSTFPRSGSVGGPGHGNSDRVRRGDRVVTLSGAVDDTRS